MKHIGIVACSAEGAALCFKSVCSDAQKLLGDYQHPEVSMHVHSLSSYVTCLEQDDLMGVAKLMQSSADKLFQQGADILICPDNTIHQAFGYIASRYTERWLPIGKVIVEQAQLKRFQKLGLLGTQWLVKSDLYPELLREADMDCVRPNEGEIHEVDRIIMQELINGEFRAESRDKLFDMIQSFKNQGCDAVIMGCTEIPLLMDNTNAALPLLDSTRLLASAAVKRAIESN